MASTGKRRKSVIVRLLLLVFSVYIIISLINLQVQLVERKQQLTSSKAVLESKNLQINELERLLENGTEADLIEKSARERLGYVYPDEQVFVDRSGQ